MLASFSVTKALAFAMVDFGQSIGHAWPPTKPGPGRAEIGAFDAARSGENFAVEAMSLEQMDAAQAAWADLAARALEPNAFYEPGFALSAARHFPLKARPRFVVAWSRPDAAGGRRMMGLFPIVAPNPIFGDGFVRLWLHKQAALATPLVDRDEAPAVLESFLVWLERRSMAAGVVFSKTTKDGAFHKAVRMAAAADHRRTRLLDLYERAALLPGGDADELCARAGSKKKLSELHRMRRRLAELGKVDFVSFTAPDDVRGAMEDFLTLEASGWKGGRGALLSHPSLATFVRSATRLLARQGKCKIHALRLDGRPVAMAILIESQGRSYCWKIAFDEAFRSQAPGIQLVYEQTKAQLARPEVDMTDSCAIANHPMIDRIWPDRVAICDVGVQLQIGRERSFARSCRKEYNRRSLRALVKRAVVRVLKRKVN